MNQQATLFLTSDNDPGSYCCGNVDATGNCSFATGGSKKPFKGPGNGAVIWDRKTGSTDLDKLLALAENKNTTETKTVTVTASGTSIPANTGIANGGCAAGSTEEKICPKNNEVAIGAGIGGGMAAALIAVGALLVWQIRKRREAERRLQEMMVSPPGQHYDVGNGSWTENRYVPMESKTSNRSELPGEFVGSEMRG